MRDSLEAAATGNEANQTEAWPSEILSPELGR